MYRPAALDSAEALSSPAPSGWAAPDWASALPVHTKLSASTAAEPASARVGEEIFDTSVSGGWVVWSGAGAGLSERSAPSADTTGPDRLRPGRGGAAAAGPRRRRRRVIHGPAPGPSG